MEITDDTVRALVSEQFPRWADLPVTPVPEQGHDNRTFRLGDELSVRLPSGDGYVAAVAKEDTHLPLIARHVGTTVPVPVASGEPGAGYPHPWSVREWIPGTTPDHDDDLDRLALARELGTFLRELRSVPTEGAPWAGWHSFHRGNHPSAWGHSFQETLRELGDSVDTDACRSVWADAMCTAWAGDPVWFHGDVAPGNLLTRDGRLAAVIDFGTCGVGDPACDLVIAWTFFTPAERAVFRDAVALPDDTWARARGWAIWKALITLGNPDSPLHPQQVQAYEELMAEHRG
ncbi:aminoglycoside phosphotransferase family protein [Nocardioides currus]|uniref:Acetyltransferase n=1 Tax=Nocardioides currus TaxID=2133958 RepID=A0A2R7Z1Q1_9ACTN|nr:aminoglycoside phosphotransferase family protein [Nocardioides currus]PUA82540.1 acetyltransferase [Nocardioides currus]